MKLISRKGHIRYFHLSCGILVLRYNINSSYYTTEYQPTTSLYAQLAYSIGRILLTVVFYI